LIGRYFADGSQGDMAANARHFRFTPSKQTFGSANGMSASGQPVARADCRGTEVHASGQAGANARSLWLKLSHWSFKNHNSPQIFAGLEIGIAEIDVVEAIGFRDQFAQLQITLAVQRK
jgi:hypothetical protein